MPTLRKPPPVESLFFLCSDHLTADSFERSICVDWARKSITLGAISTIYKTLFN